jgi:hypothetical protein
VNVLGIKFCFVCVIISALDVTDCSASLLVVDYTPIKSTYYVHRHGGYNENDSREIVTGRNLLNATDCVPAFYPHPY